MQKTEENFQEWWQQGSSKEDRIGDNNRTVEPIVRRYQKEEEKSEKINSNEG